MNLGFDPCSTCRSPMACRDVGMCAGSPFVKPTTPVAVNTANKPPAQQVELDFHIRSMLRIIGEQVVESNRFKHVRADREDVKDLVAHYSIDTRLTAYLVGMLGLEGKS